MLMSYLKYLNPKARQKIVLMQDELNIDIIVCNPSITRLGVFIVRIGDKNLIKINNDLNQESFLITLLHELAHAFVYKKYRNTIRPHGKEWKSMYKLIMLDFLHPDYFDRETIKVLSRHLLNPKASSNADFDLYRLLNVHESDKTVSDLNDGDEFIFRNNRYRRVCKLRKNYQCIQIATNKIYRFSPIAKIQLL